MNTNELRQSKDYKEAVDKIANYRKGFRFTINYAPIPTAKANGLKFILRDCQEKGLIECVAVGLDLDMNVTEETFIRL